MSCCLLEVVAELLFRCVFELIAHILVNEFMWTLLIVTVAVVVYFVWFA